MFWGPDIFQTNPWEVLVSVRVAGITPTELLWVPTNKTRQGTCQPSPVIPGLEFSDEIIAIGEGLSGIAPVDMVEFRTVLFGCLNVLEMAIGLG